MSTPHANFPPHMQKAALLRQRHRCAGCGSWLDAIGEGARTGHQFGERAEGHHVIPHLKGGPITIENCVVICRACHLNSHQGGRWRDVSIYNDITNPPTQAMIAKIAALYPYYRGVNGPK